MRSTTVGGVAATILASVTSPVAAFWRMPCPGRLTLQRIDPIISPGKVSGHVHTVSGGSGFGFTTSFAQQRASACSSCPVKQDLSAYWTPKLYYMSEDGSYFEDVMQAGEGPGVTGGLTVYYEQRGPNLEDLIPFPEGFRMMAGDPFQRNETYAQAAPGEAVSFVCLDYSGTSSQSLGMPNINCPDGLRAQVYFPSCWSGKYVDAPDGGSAVADMAYPTGGHYDNGPCPASHPKQTISIFYEVIYQTNDFADRWYGDSQPFVFAMGDRTGYGFHGDFVNGWDVEALGQAIKECTNDSGSLSDCPIFDDLYSDEECQACRIPKSVHERYIGNLSALPGCNPPTSGPEYAPPPENCPVTPIGTPIQDFSNVNSMGWEYVGCANDSVSSRTFQGSMTWSDDMTVSMCIKYCKSEGYQLAGLEYANQCYCDNDYNCDGGYDCQPSPNILGSCMSRCQGNRGEVCGGASALSVYKNCENGDCENAVFHVNGTKISKEKRHLHEHQLGRRSHSHHLS